MGFPLQRKEPFEGEVVGLQVFIDSGIGAERFGREEDEFMGDTFVGRLKGLQRECFYGGVWME